MGEGRNRVMYIIQGEVIRKRKTSHNIYHLYVEYRKMIQTNLFAKQKKRHRHKVWIYGCQEGKGE